MTKKDAIDLFNDVKSLAAALGVSRHAIYQWPDQLDQRKVDLVIGAAVRLGRINVSQNEMSGV